MVNIANDLLAKKWFSGFFSSENNDSRLRILGVSILTICRWLSSAQGVSVLYEDPPKPKTDPQIGPLHSHLYTNLDPPQSFIHKSGSSTVIYSQTCPKSVKKRQKVKITVSFCPKVSISDPKKHIKYHDKYRKRFTRKKVIFWLFFFRK